MIGGVGPWCRTFWDPMLKNRLIVSRPNPQVTSRRSNVIRPPNVHPDGEEFIEGRISFGIAGAYQDHGSGWCGVIWCGIVVAGIEVALPEFACCLNLVPLKSLAVVGAFEALVEFFQCMFCIEYLFESEKIHLDVIVMIGRLSVLAKSTSSLCYR
jgi:hypothetical protein